MKPAVQPQQVEESATASTNEAQPIEPPSHDEQSASLETRSGVPPLSPGQDKVASTTVERGAEPLGEQPKPDGVLAGGTQREASKIPRGVTFSTETPREILAREGVTQESFELAPDPGRASPMAVGTSMELRTPDGAALFTVRAKEQVRAQAYTTDVPPASFPAGLELHSPIYVVRAEPDYAQANTAVVIHAQGSLVPDLKLYVLDGDQGWIPLAGQRTDAGSGTFTGIDFGVRAYALLAPAR
jgi:hypothetical protein